MNILQSDIYLVNLNPTLGDEVNKIRPCIVINDDKIGILKSKIVVPLTHWDERYDAVPWMIKITPDRENKLSKISSADAFQVRNVSHQRFVKKIGVISEEVLFEIHTAVAKNIINPLCIGLISTVLQRSITIA